MALDVCTQKEDGRSKFQYLASRFASLVYGGSEGDRQQINLLLDELNALDFKSPTLVNLDVGQFFCLMLSVNICLI
jgi:hypothetical protein